MRLEQFITESRSTKIEFDTVDIEEKVTKMASLLFKDCKQYLKDLNIKNAGKVMYRGARGGDMTKIIPRKDRVPKDMDQDLSNALDDEFEREFGWEPRSEGVFCSGDRDQAAGYGNVFTVWPIGKYKFLWSWSIFDLYTKMDQMGSSDYIDTDYFYTEWDETYGEGGEGSWYYDGDDTEETDKDKAEEVVLDWIEKQHEKDYSEYEDDDFDPQDELDDLSFEWTPDIDQESYVEDRAEQAREDLKDERLEVTNEYQDKDINKALRTGNEIMLGCNSYYLIDDDFSNELIKVLSKGKIKPVHKQLKFQFAYRKKRR